MLFRQIRSQDGTGTLSYILGDPATGEAAVIDPNINDTQRVLRIAQDMGVRISTVIDTHTHADHVSAAGELKRHTGARLVMHEETKNKWKVVDQGDAFGIGDILRANAAHEVDRYVRDGETVKVGSMELHMLLTPGHTDNHISVRAGDMLFTGDLLLIGQAGRSDLPGGNAEQQYTSLFGTVMSLPDSTKIYPGHDYEGREYALLGDERRTNPFLQPRTKEAYVEFVKDFFPPFAEATEGGTMTLQCGTKRVSTAAEGYQRVSAAELASLIQREPGLHLLDVREPFELVAFGTIPGVQNIPVGELAFRTSELPADLTRPIAVICASGNRSSEAAHYLVTRGYARVFDLDGGIYAWKKDGRTLVRGPVNV